MIKGKYNCYSSSILNLESPWSFFNRTVISVTVSFFVLLGSHPAVAIKGHN